MPVKRQFCHRLPVRTTSIYRKNENEKLSIVHKWTNNNLLPSLIRAKWCVEDGCAHTSNAIELINCVMCYSPLLSAGIQVGRRMRVTSVVTAKMTRSAPLSQQIICARVRWFAYLNGREAMPVPVATITIRENSSGSGVLAKTIFATTIRRTPVWCHFFLRWTDTDSRWHKVDKIDNW